MNLELNFLQTLDALNSGVETFLCVDDLFGEMCGYVKVDPSNLASLIREQNEKGWPTAYRGRLDTQKNILFFELGED